MKAIKAMQKGAFLALFAPLVISFPQQSSAQGNDAQDEGPIEEDYNWRGADRFCDWLEGAGFEDADYEAVGAKMAPDAQTVFAEADMVVKVKEPQATERAMLREGQVLFTYLHLAPDPEQTKDRFRLDNPQIA